METLGNNVIDRPLRMLQDRFEVRAVYAPVPLLAEQVAKEFGAAQVDGYRALVARSDVDAVLILESSWQGWLPILAACDAGKAVYWAADLALEPDVARNLTDRVDRSGVAFMAEFPRRFAPATLRLKELIATHLGKPRLLFCHRRLPVEVNAKKGPSPVQQANREMVELIDWCRYVVGSEPSSVLSLVHGLEPNPDYRLLSVRFEGPRCVPEGVTCQISCGQYIPSDGMRRLVSDRRAGYKFVAKGAWHSLIFPPSWFGLTKPVDMSNHWTLSVQLESNC